MAHIMEIAHPWFDSFQYLLLFQLILFRIFILPKSIMQWFIHLPLLFLTSQPALHSIFLVSFLQLMLLLVQTHSFFCLQYLLFWLLNHVRRSFCSQFYSISNFVVNASIEFSLIEVNFRIHFDNFCHAFLSL